MTSSVASCWLTRRLPSSRITGVDRDTISEKARRFLTKGMLGLVDRRTTTEKRRRRYPDVVAGYILYLKQLYPTIHSRVSGESSAPRFAVASDS